MYDEKYDDDRETVWVRVKVRGQTVLLMRRVEEEKKSKAMSLFKLASVAAAQ